MLLNVITLPASIHGTRKPRPKEQGKQPDSQQFQTGYEFAPAAGVGEAAPKRATTDFNEN
jgi:hypothetical protein